VSPLLDREPRKPEIVCRIRIRKRNQCQQSVNIQNSLKEKRLMKRTALAVSTFTLFAAMAAFGQSSGQKSFDTMKSLAGNWEGKDSMGGAVEISNRVTVRGSAVMSEIKTSMHGKS